MSINRIKLSEFSQLDEAGKDAKLAEFSKSRQESPNGHLTYLNERIAEYEITYEMSSEAMVEALKTRRIKETADICSWMMLVDVRKHLAR